jgi:PAS domain S-box-containing protein
MAAPHDAPAATLLAHALQHYVLLDAAGHVVLGEGSALAPALGIELRDQARPLWDHAIWDAQPDGRQRIRQAIGRAAQGEAQRLAARVQTPGGVQALELTLSPARDAEGALLGIVAETRNITEQVEAEAELRASERKFAGILAIAADAIITVDEAHVILHFNRGAERIFGWRAEEVLGKELAMLLPPRFHELHDRHMHAFARGPEQARRMGERRDIAGLRRDGTEFPAEASISRLDLPGRRLFTVQLRDITERRRAERNDAFLAEASVSLGASLDEESVLRTAATLPLSHFAHAVVVELHRADGHVRRVVAPGHGAVGSALQAYAAGLGRAASEVRTGVVRGVMRARVPLLLPKVSPAWLAATAAPDERRLVEGLGATSLLVVPLVARDEVVGALWLLRMGGHYDEVDLALAGELGLRMGPALDNAALYRVAQDATHARDRVLGVVSHDLRQPLAAVAMCARVLRDAPPADEAQRREMLGTVHDATELMQRMIQDLLDIASIEGGRLALERVRVIPGALAERAVALAEAEAATRGVQLTLEMRDAIPPALLDGERILQVLGNLLANAIKYTERGGRVAVEIARHEEGLQYVVTDSGAGIPRDDLPHIFDLYWHARRTARRRGSGYGLAIVKGIVEAHGGTVHAESELGRGSRFIVRLPIADEEPAGS